VALLGHKESLGHKDHRAFKDQAVLKDHKDQAELAVLRD
jgi:hypothetical protein